MLFVERQWADKSMHYVVDLYNFLGLEGDHTP